jgi:hypothetical protein
MEAMGLFRIHRMKESAQQQFRWAPHTSGATDVKPKDYNSGEALEASSFYDVWAKLKESDGPLNLGDLVESETGEVRICKYIGFEEARWLIPEMKTGLENVPLAAGAAGGGESPAGPAL